MELTRIGPIASHLGVTPQTIRNWEKAGIIPPAPRTRNGFRVYRVEDIKTIERAAFGDVPTAA
jgi:DNA-binding transcriptional MerR regulator